MGDDPIKALMKQFEELKKAAETLEKRKRRKANWDVPGERLAYIRKYKQDKRARVIEKLAPGRRCPICNEVKLKSRAWVFFNRTEIMQNTSEAAIRLREMATQRRADPERLVCCRGCVMRHFKEELWNGK